LEYYRQNLEKIRICSEANPYGVGQLFIWCSNNLAAAVANQAMLYEIMSGDNSYRMLMQDHINWLLGLNSWGTSMITGIPEGTDTPLDVHMPFWMLRGEIIRGSLVDGPLWTTIHGNMLGIRLSGEDQYAHLQPPHIRYHDDWMDYSTNEPTLDGSAEMLMFLAYLGERYPVFEHDLYGARIRTMDKEKSIHLCFTAHDRLEGFEHVLQVLRNNEVKGSFFLTGDFIRNHPELVSQINAEGHTVGAHSDKHLLYNAWENRDSLLLPEDSIREDIRRNLKELEDLGIRPRYFLPPYEWYNSRVSAMAAEQGQITVNFTPGIRTNADYTTPDMPNYLSSEQILDSFLHHEETQGLDGCHVLIHPGTDPRRKDKFYLHLEELIAKLRAKGYRFDSF
jgi:peptidoglycan/xylan/chitin deacetylase (PgdA/CDA1 family)